MDREPTTIVLAPVHATLVRRFLQDCFNDPTISKTIDWDAQGLTKVVLEDVLRQIAEDLTRPCVECTRNLFEVQGLGRRLQGHLLTTMTPDDPRWCRQDIKTQMVVGVADPTVTYNLACGHTVIDL